MCVSVHRVCRQKGVIVESRTEPEKTAEAVYRESRPTSPCYGSIGRASLAMAMTGHRAMFTR